MISFSLSLYDLKNSELSAERCKTDTKHGEKTQLGTQIADVSCVQRQIKTAGPLQRDVI